LSPRATLYSPPPSHTRKERVVAMRPSPGSRRSMTSPSETRSKRQPDFGLIVSAISISLEEVIEPVHEAIVGDARAVAQRLNDLLPRGAHTHRQRDVDEEIGLDILALRKDLGQGGAGEPVGDIVGLHLRIITSDENSSLGRQVILQADD